MTIFSILFVFSAIQGFILTVILLSQSSRRKLSGNLFLAVLIAIIAAQQLKYFLYMEGYMNAIPHLLLVLLPLLFMIGPILYIYIQFEIDPNFKLDRRSFVHLVIPTIYIISLLPFYIKSGQEKLALCHSLHEIIPYIYWLQVGVPISFMTYSILSLYRMGKAKANQDGRSEKNGFNRFRWLKIFVWYFVFLSIIVLGYLIFHVSNFYNKEIHNTTIVVFSFSIHFLGFWSLKESRMIKKTDQITSQPYLSKEKASKLKVRVVEMLEKERVFLDSNLTAKEFCYRLSINTQYFSNLINTEFGCSFTSLINSHRIEYAKTLIESPKYQNLNFYGIALEAGFNSKNTFTNAFKKQMGITPSGYKRSLVS